MPGCGQTSRPCEPAWVLIRCLSPRSRCRRHRPRRDSDPTATVPCRQRSRRPCRGAPPGNGPLGEDVERFAVRDRDRALVTVGDEESLGVPAGIYRVGALPVWMNFVNSNDAASMTHTPLRSMSAARKYFPLGDSRTSCGMAEAPLRRFALAPPEDTPPAGWSRRGVVTVEIDLLEHFRRVRIEDDEVSENSHEATKKPRSLSVSAWFTPARGTEASGRRRRCGGRRHRCG